MLRKYGMVLLVVSVSFLVRAQVLPPVFYEGFEDNQDKASAAWEKVTWGGDAAFERADGGHGGVHCMVVSSAAGADASWSITLPVNPNSVYRLSGWVKTQDVATDKGKGALLNVHELQQATFSAPITGTRDWSEVSMTFDTGDLKEIQINCLLGGWGTATGTAYFDDIRLDHLTQDNLVPAVRLHGGDIGAPISKYVYAQFIEHLGRCIYGGIWAEMLEDRKFYYDVGAKESPWKGVGGEGAVSMVKEAAFVGEHAPVVALAADVPHGIAQTGLGIVAGKEYSGYAVLAGSGTAQLALVWGTGEQDRAVAKLDGVGETYKKFSFRVTAGATTDDARLELTATGAGALRIGTLSLMPADNVDGMRADTLAVLKELNAPVYRWPGGNFVSGYDWHDGIGDRDKRPTRKNPAWKGVEHNDFGADEFHRFLKEVNAEGYLVVNSGEGGVESAVEEVQYHLGGASTPGGKLRKENGHASPYALGFIGIGNEMYGDWQLGHMPLADYVAKHNAFAKAIEKEAPKVQLVGVGATGNWSETMLKECADHMSLLSEHFYCGTKNELISHVQQIPDAIRAKVSAHEDYHARIPELRGKRIPICMDEWNYWYGPHPYGELGTQYFLKDALGIAEGLNAFYRASNTVFMANYAQTVNVIGCVKTSKTAACLDTTGVVLALYRNEFGTLPIAIEGSAFPVDVAAAWTENKDALTVSVVNPTHEPYDVAIGVDGMRLPEGGTRWVITGADPMSKNVPGEAPGVTVKAEALEGTIRSFPAPPLSACLYKVSVHK